MEAERANGNCGDESSGWWLAVGGQWPSSDQQQFNH
jgi:hypothetical protein